MVYKSIRIAVPLAYNIQPSLNGCIYVQVAGEGTANSFMAMAVSPRYWSTAGLTMKVEGVRAARTQTTTVTKISTDINANIWGGKN